MFCSEWFLSLENNLIYIGNHFKLGIRFLGLGYFENEQIPVLYRFLSFSRRLTILKFCLIIFFVTFTVLLFYILSPLPFCCCSTFLSFNNFEILKFCQWTFLLLYISDVCRRCYLCRFVFSVDSMHRLFDDGHHT